MSKISIEVCPVCRAESCNGALWNVTGTVHIAYTGKQKIDKVVCESDPDLRRNYYGPGCHVYEVIIGHMCRDYIVAYPEGMQPWTNDLSMFLKSRTTDTTEKGGMYTAL